MWSKYEVICSKQTYFMRISVFTDLYIGNNRKFPALLNKSAISPDLGMESSQNSPKVCQIDTN